MTFVGPTLVLHLRCFWVRIVNHRLMYLNTLSPVLFGKLPELLGGRKQGGLTDWPHFLFFLFLLLSVDKIWSGSFLSTKLTCLPYHDGLYPFWKSSQIHPSPLSSFINIREVIRGRPTAAHTRATAHPQAAAQECLLPCNQHTWTPAAAVAAGAKTMTSACATVRRT